MNDLKQVLSRTELKNSKIVKVDENYTFNMLSEIEDTILTKKGNEKIVRIVVINNSVIKLRSKDNGTPIIYSFEEPYTDSSFINFVTHLFCKKYDLILSKLTI